jgi:hypothetical protein
MQWRAIADRMKLKLIASISQVIEDDEDTSDDEEVAPSR